MYRSLKLAGALLMALVLVACGGRTSEPAPSLTPSLSSDSRVLGVGSIALGEAHEIAFQDIDGVLSYGDISVSAPIVGTATLSNVDGSTARYFRARVTVTNNSGADLDNLTLLGVALPGLPQLSDSLTFAPVITPRGAGGVTLPDEADLIRSIKPTHSPNLNLDDYAVLNRHFVAYDLDTVIDADFITDADGILTAAFGGDVTHENGGYYVFPYGFSNGDILAGGTTEIDLAFRLPPNSGINSFTFTFLAIQDDTARVVQAPEEIDLSNPPVDTGTAGAENAFTAGDADALVFIGPGTRIVSSAAAVSAEANKLANVLIAGGFAFGDNSFAETFLLDVSEDPIIFDGGDLNIAFDSAPEDGIAGQAIPGAGGTVRLIVTDDDAEPVSNIPVTLSVDFEDTTDETNPSFAPADFSFSEITVLTDVDGIAEFTNIVLTIAGEYDLLFTSAGGSFVSADIEVSSGPLDSISIPQMTLDLYDGNEFGAGATLPLTIVSAVDEFGNLKLETANVDVALRRNGASSGVALGGTTSVALNLGQATFNDLSIDTVNTGYSLRFTTVVDGEFESVETPAFDIGEGAAELVIIQQVASPNKAGEPLSGATPGQDLAIQVLATDGTGIPNRVVTATLNSGTFAEGINVNGPTSVDVATDGDGVAAFTDLTIGVPGTYSITFTVDGGGTPGVNENTTEDFVVVAGKPASIEFTTSPAPTVGSDDFDTSATVLVKDKFGNNIEGIGVLVGRVAPNPLRVAVGDNTGTSPSDRTVATNAGGEATFNIFIVSNADGDDPEADGSITLRFTIPGVADLELLSDPITVTVD